MAWHWQAQHPKLDDEPAVLLQFFSPAGPIDLDWRRFRGHSKAGNEKKKQEAHGAEKTEQRLAATPSIPR